MFVLIVALSAAWLSAEEPPGEGGAENRVVDLAEMILGKNGGDRLFYFPTRSAPDLPSKYGLDFEEVSFPSEDGTKLHGWFLTPNESRKVNGTVVFHHGNAGSVGYHLGFVAWMVRAGYQVLLYDYRGYGKSEGKLERSGLVKDTRAALRYVRKREDVDGDRLISFGHSLGGAKSLAGLGREMVPGVRGVISFAGFASYRDMARRFAGETGAKLVSDDHSPREVVDRIAPVPLLIVHGQKDLTVPLQQGEILFKKAKDPKSIFRIPEGSHTRALWMNDGEYRKHVLRWMEKVLAG
jgi:fermentation-respiration switch protein FrsA (DUF1100 family)